MQSQEVMKHSYPIGEHNISNYSITNVIKFEFVAKGIITWFVDEYMNLDIDIIEISKKYSEMINGTSFSLIQV